MKTLVVFYSRTGTTKKVANTISKILDCNSEEIIDTKSRHGVIGYLISGKDATLRKLTQIKDIKRRPEIYDLVIIGTPVWAYNMATPIRTYITLYKERFKKVAFFCTMGGSGSEKTFKEMKSLCGKKPIGLLELKTKEVVEDKYLEKAKKFIKNLRR